MSETEEPGDVQEEQERTEPRLRVLKGKPWRIDPGRRAKWSDEDFVRRHALDIRQIGDPVLHRVCMKPTLPRAELEALVQTMFASMVAAHGVGIAAPQIGVPLRIAIMDVDEMGIVAIDPRIEWTSPEVEETSEGCLSVRGFYGMLERPLVARFVATDIGGHRFTVEGDEVGAQVILHETDHLSGTLYISHLRSREDLRPVEPDETEEATA